MEMIAFQRFGDTSVISKCSLGVNLVSDHFLLCSFRFFISVCVAVACGARLSCSVFMVYSVLLSVSLVASAPI